MARIFWRVANFVVLAAHLFRYSEAVITNPVDTLALQAFRKTLVDPDDHLSNWRGSNPCDDAWEGIACSEPQGPNNITYVTELRLFGRNLGGTLAPELGNLAHLEYLNVMWNELTGSIPSTLGKVANLELMLLNGNQLTGILPPELGSLAKLTRIQIDENRISGPIPPEFAGMTSMQHLHMNNNSLNGSIPKELGTLPNLVHILVDNNELTGQLPPEIADAPNLLIIQLDNNQFASNATIPAIWGSIPKLLKLSLRNCGLTGTIPDLANLTRLEVLDLSNNKLAGIIPNTTTAFPVNLTSIDLSHNQLSGQIPESIGNLQSLEYLTLKNNRLRGAVPQNLGTGKAFQSTQGLQIIDLQNNQLTSFNASLAALESKTSTKVRLAGNPSICNTANLLTNPLCVPSNDPFLLPYDSALTPENTTTACTSCAPITVGFRLKSPGFASFDRYDALFVSWFAKGFNLTQRQVTLKEYAWERGPRLRMTILLFARNATTFEEGEFERLYTNFSQWDVTDSARFGPWELLSFEPRSLPDLAAKIHGISKAAIAGIVIGVAAFAMLATGLLLFLLHWRRRPSAAVRAQIKRLNKAKNNPALKVSGVTAFTYEDLARATNNFDAKNQIGQGGYGRVFVGDLKDRRVAIKRAELGSLQGDHEFYTEIELLSRVHHRNLCGLVGYCDDVGEQMLVYEFMPGGTLRDHLSALSGTPLNFPTRLRIALGSARGILYLHKEANPPIFHRDIKASNILLDARLVAKVADFGLSKLAPVPDLEGAAPGHVSTVVKGTPGYLDPEYFLTHKLTDKSDVYSFGVVLLELITGMPAISKGKNIVREAHARNEAGEILSMIDPHISHYSSKALKSFMQLAVQCCSAAPEERPSMAEVVHALEDLGRQHADLFSADASSVEAPSDNSALLSSSSFPYSYPYSSRDGELSGSELFSNTVMHVATR